LTLLELGHPEAKGRAAPAADPVARPVILWVGIADPDLAPVRGQLPATTQRILECADAGVPHCVRVGGGPHVALKRIRYTRTALGYGIEIARWMTIAPKGVRPDDEEMDARVGYARRILKALGIACHTYLTDRPSL
jgi:hypothetical protein